MYYISIKHLQLQSLNYHLIQLSILLFKSFKYLCSLDSCFEASDWEKRYEFVWALDSDIDLSKAVTCGDRRVRRVVSLDWPLRDGSGGFAPIPGDCAADGCTHCWTNLCQSLNQTQFVVMRKMKKIDVLRSWNQFCWLIVCWFMGAEYLRVWRVSHLVEVHKGGASLVQMQDLVILNHLRHNCFHKKWPCGWDNGLLLGMLTGALQDSSASVIRREGHSPTRHHSHHGHQVSGTELSSLMGLMWRHQQISYFIYATTSSLGPNEMQIPDPGDTGPFKMAWLSIRATCHDV